MKVHDQKKKKSLFIPIKLHSITISSVIQYTSEVHSTSSPFKKKKKEALTKEEERKTRWKREEKEQRGGNEEKKKKGMEKVCAKGKEKGRMTCGKKEERKEERMKEREKEKKGEEEKEE